MQGNVDEQHRRVCRNLQLATAEKTGAYGDRPTCAVPQHVHGRTCGVYFQVIELDHCLVQAWIVDCAAEHVYPSDANVGHEATVHWILFRCLAIHCDRVA
jgi:hypothetical protein